MKKLVALIIVLIPFCSIAQYNIYKILNNNAENITALESDTSGIIYSALIFDKRPNPFGAIDQIVIETDTGDYIITPQTTQSIGILKQGVNGSLKFFKQIELNFRSNGSKGLSIKVDIHKNIYIAGIFYSKVDFDPGLDSSFLTSNDSEHLPSFFVLKLDQFGNFIWVKKIRTDAAYSHHTKLFFNNKYELVLISAFAGYADFDPDTASVAKSIHYPHPGIFILRLDTNGTYIDAKQIGTGTYLTDVVLDYNLDFIITGFFRLPTDFDPDLNANLFYPFKSIQNSFIGKYNSDGNLIWVNRMYTNSRSPASVSVDKLNNIYAYGGISGATDTFDFQLGSNNPNRLVYHEQTKSFFYICEISPLGQVEKINVMYEEELYRSVKHGIRGEDGHYLSGNYVESATYFPNFLRKIDNDTNIVFDISYQSIHGIEFMNFVRPNTIIAASFTSYKVTPNGYNAGPGVYYIIIDDASIGFDEKKLKKENIKLYPNPTNGNLQIDHLNVKKVEIYDISGKLVKVEFSSIFSVRMLKSGIYFVRVYSDNEINNLKFIKE